ncbi:MAG: choice-of-anchor E domain-containing protein [Planctomycetes bacterium]|nr:choice-of-anchor E domain-containing protein [Planctomycetota bacterium]
MFWLPEAAVLNAARGLVLGRTALLGQERIRYTGVLDMLGPLNPRLRHGILALAACLVLAGPAFGSYISSDPNANPLWYKYDSRQAGADPQGPFPVNASGTFELPQFDDQGGQRTLKYVTLVCEGFSFNGSVVLDNENPNHGGTASIEVGANINVTSSVPTAPLVVLVIPNDSNTGTITADDDPDYFGDFTGPDSIAAGAQPGYDSEFETLDETQDLSDYVGNGMIPWDFTSSTLVTYQSDVGAFFVRSREVDFDLTATVYYGWETGVPEPATLCLLGASGVGLLLKRRRRRLSGSR